MEYEKEMKMECVTEIQVEFEMEAEMVVVTEMELLI